MRAISVIVLGIFAAATAAAENIEQTLDADANGTVSVSNVAGSVEVEGWSRDQVEVTGVLGDDVEELIFERDGDEIEIKVKAGRRSSHDVRSDLFIKVPLASTLEIHTVSADIEIVGVTGEQDLESVSGDINTEAHEADIDADTVSGDLEVVGTGNRARSNLSSVSGDIDTENLAGEIRVESVSGDVLVESGVLERAVLGTVNGDITFNGQLLDGGRLDVESVNGGVDIAFAGEISARFDIETFNGDIRNCFGPDASRVSEYGPGYELKFTEGAGSGRVTIETLNGDLRLCR